MKQYKERLNLFFSTSIYIFVFVRLVMAMRSVCILKKQLDNLLLSFIFSPFYQKNTKFLVI